MVMLAMLLQLVAAIAGLWFLFLVFQDSVKWFLIFLIGIPVAYTVLSGMVGVLIAFVIVIIPTLGYVKNNWERVGKSWAVSVGAGVLSSVLALMA